MAKIAVLGYGTVGSGVVEILDANAESISKKAGQPIEVKSVLDLRDFPGDPIQEKIVHDIDLVINDDEIDVVVEVMGGVEPAFTFVKRALEAGKSVCTSNKALVAAHGAELLAMAKERSLNFMFEASVGGGIPIIRPLNQALTGDMLDENGQVPNFEKAMLSDALATCVGAVCGTSTVTTFVESSSGVAEGGRTGLSSFTTGCLFFVAMFLSPIAALIPGSATAAALIYVGVLMMGGVAKIDWNDISVAVPAFLTIAFMSFAYNISYGIAFGLISYILIKVFSGKSKEVKAFTWVIAILFTLMFFLTQ